MTDLAVGDEGPTLVVEDVSRRDFVAYAGASGDFNPIHYDDSYATDAGNPSVFGQGMFTAGVAANVLVDWVGLAALRRYRARFTDRVWPGDTLVASAIVTDVDEAASTAEVAVTVETDDDRTVATGDATVALD